MPNHVNTMILLRRLFVGLVLGGLICLPARAVEPIKIGFGMGLTGGLAASGKAALLAMKIWEEETNAEGGLLGRPVKLIYYDDQSNPATVPRHLHQTPRRRQGRSGLRRLRYQSPGAGYAGGDRAQYDVLRAVRPRC